MNRTCCHCSSTFASPRSSHSHLLKTIAVEALSSNDPSDVFVVSPSRSSSPSSGLPLRKSSILLSSPPREATPSRTSRSPSVSLAGGSLMMGGINAVDLRDRERRESGVSLGGQAERMMVDGGSHTGSASGSALGDSGIITLKTLEHEVSWFGPCSKPILICATAYVLFLLIRFQFSCRPPLAMVFLVTLPRLSRLLHLETRRIRLPCSLLPMDLLSLPLFHHLLTLSKRRIIITRTNILILIRHLTDSPSSRHKTSLHLLHCQHYPSPPSQAVFPSHPLRTSRP